MSSSPATVQPCPADASLSSPVQGVYDPGLLDTGQDPDACRSMSHPACRAGVRSTPTPPPSPPRTCCARPLVAKLAVDLDDPTLARRAATEAAEHARQLAGLDLPAPEDDDTHASDMHGLTVGRLLRRLYPPVTEDDETESLA